MTSRMKRYSSSGIFRATNVSILSPEQKEIRALRLTGAFSQQELLQQLASLAKFKES